MPAVYSSTVCGLRPVIERCCVVTEITEEREHFRARQTIQAADVRVKVVLNYVGRQHAR